MKPIKKHIAQISVRFPVILQWGKRRFRCQARQLSEFGILIAFDQKEIVGEKIELNFTLKSSISKLSLSGIVVFAREDEIGIRFRAVTAEQRLVLHDYVQARGIGSTERKSRIF